MLLFNLSKNLTPQVSHYFSLSWKDLSITTLLRRIRLILNFSLSFASLSSLYCHLSEFYLSMSIVNVYWTPTVLKILCKMWLRIPGNIKGITWVEKHKQVQKVHSIFWNSFSKNNALWQRWELCSSHINCFRSVFWVVWIIRDEGEVTGKKRRQYWSCGLQQSLLSYYALQGFLGSSL